MCQRRAICRAVSAIVFACLGPMICIISLARADDPQSGITHGFLATGAETYIRDGQGRITWQYPDSTRDGWLLPSGNILLALSKSKSYPGGGVVEIQKDGKVVFEYKGTQAEVNTAQAIDGHRILISEAGDKPRLLELDRNGQILAEVALKAQIKDHHLQTRMARKLANGNFLVPQLLDRVVREYTSSGAVVWEVQNAEHAVYRHQARQRHTRSSGVLTATWSSKSTPTAKPSGS